MVDVFTLVSFIAAIMQVIHLGLKAICQLEGLYSSRSENFETTRGQLKVLGVALGVAEEKARGVCIGGDDREILQETIEGCRSDVEKLRGIFERPPLERDSWVKRFKNMVSLAGQNKEIERIKDRLKKNINALTYCEAAGFSGGRGIEESLSSFFSNQGRIDIKAFIQKRLQTDQGLRKWQNRPELQQKIETKIINKADGMPRWAECQLDAVGKCPDRRSLRKVLEHPPGKLVEIYDRTLCAIPEECSRYALTIFQWLAFSARTLKIDEIIDAIAVDCNSNPRFHPGDRFPDPQDILAICSGLVTFVGEEVKFVHPSVGEYLVSAQIIDGPACQYSIQKIAASISIAETCIAYLLQFDKANSLTRRAAKEYPLAGYAGKYWVQHTRDTGNTGMVSRLVGELYAQNEAYPDSNRLFDL
ncbi:MAG: hypothetical protein M1840_000453 [Geoglossum simile]|nr:MAG: hypothetical protein M1840_000453 [Geoglossum simile]